ncbi:MAG: APC family permease [Solirubrobacteraceae bacterium]|nr:APC family permease [Solirubrobacteraceae bacterium]
MSQAATPTGPLASGGAHDGPELNRAISRNLLLLFVVGDVVGGGIYTLVGEIGAEVGGMVWLPMLLALSLALFTAASYAELVTKYPQAAGAALYVNKAFDRPFFTFIVAFAVMCSGIASAATLARGVSGKYLPQLWTETPIVPVAIVFLLLVAALNFRGISESVRVNVVLTIIELSGLLLVIVIAIAALGDGQGDLSNAFTTDGAESGLLGAALAGTALAFYALIGFEDSVNVAEEAQEPRRDYPRALFGGILLAGVIYLIIGVLAPAVLDRDVLLDTENGTPLISLASTGPLGVDPKLFAVIGILALANGALINMIMASRLIYGMSAQSIIPRALGKVHATRRTPYVAIVFTTALAMALASTGSVSDLASTTVVLLLSVFTVVNVAVLILRRDPVDKPHFEAPSIVPVIGAVASLAVLLYRVIDDPDQLVRAALLIALGIVLWFVNHGARRLEGGRFDTQQLEAIERADDRDFD